MALGVICFLSKPYTHEGIEYQKNQHYIDARGVVLPTQHRNNDSHCDLYIIWKTDPPEIESTYNIRKQHTWFYWVCLWEVMVSATILKPQALA